MPQYQLRKTIQTPHVQEVAADLINQCVKWMQEEACTVYRSEMENSKLYMYPTPSVTVIEGVWLEVKTVEIVKDQHNMTMPGVHGEAQSSERHSAEQSDMWKKDKDAQAHIKW